MKKAILAGIILGFLTTSAHALDTSSTAFIGALGLINADGNITTFDFNANPNIGVEGNPLAKPFFFPGSNTHFIYTALACGTCALSYEGLKTLDKKIGLNPFGLKDLLTVGIYVIECNSISSWKNGKADIGGQVLLSEAEFFITSQVLNIRF